MSARRLLVLTTSYPLTPQSCSGIFVRRMIEHLPRDLHITVVAPAARTDAVPSDRSNIVVRPFRYAPKPMQVLAHEPGGIPVALRSRRWTRVLLPAFLLSMLVSCFRHARRADVIHANWSICGCVAGVVGIVWRIPVITTLHGEDVTRARHRALDRAVLSLCLKLSDRVVAVSPAIESWLRERYPGLAHKIQTVGNGIEDELLALPLDRPDATASGRLRLLTVGSLIPRKGINRIIEAIGHLPNPRRVRLTVAGSGPELAALEQLVETLRLGDDIEFVGAVEPRMVVDLLAKADAFVLASHSEGRPSVVLEAMAAALPVIATDIDGVRDIVEHESTGLLYDGDDTFQLAGHISRLRESGELRRRLGATARRRIVQWGLLWDNTSQQYASLYRALSVETGAKKKA